MDYMQKYPETCLSKSLLIVLSKVKNRNFLGKEMEVFDFAMRYNRENFALGHLEKIVKGFGVKINWYVDTEIYYNFVKKQNPSKNIKLTLEKINLKTIDKIPKP